MASLLVFRRVLLLGFVLGIFSIQVEIVSATELPADIAECLGKPMPELEEIKAEIETMPILDVKRRLQSDHGYSAVAVGKIFDNEKMIDTLAVEEHKLRKELFNQQKRVCEMMEESYKRKLKDEL